MSRLTCVEAWSNDMLCWREKPKLKIAKGEEELLHGLDDGYKMVETLETDKYLLERI